MTTSNPSPSYVSDVTSVFNPFEANNFQKVIRAILLHEEARNSVTPTYTFGKLREPIIRLTNLLKAFPIYPANEAGDYFDTMESFAQQTGQSPLGAPSVFNFFRPDYEQRGAIQSAALESPEFQIFNSTNSIGNINSINQRVVSGNYMPDAQTFIAEANGSLTLASNAFTVDHSLEIGLASNPSQLVDHIDVLLANGLLSAGTKSTIIDAIAQLTDNGEKVRMAIYLTLMSPDYAILK